MARIYGTIESLKSLKSELEDKGISRFSSIKEIKEFLSNYKSEKQSILNDISNKLEKEYFETFNNLELKVKKKNEIINLETEKIDNRISDLHTKINFINVKNTNFLKKLISSIKLYFIEKQSNYFIENKTKLINSSIKEITRNIEEDELFIKEYETEKQNLIEKRAKFEIKKLEHSRNVIENSKNLISGAIGENLVVNEIKKLSDDYVLINDFNLRFNRPIFYKKHNQKIYSIQIERSNYALYIYLSENLTLYEHHWGEQRIPIRNLIVMINNKPTAEFKYVNIKLLRELNDYIKYFEPVLTEQQLNRIINKLI